MKTLSYRNRTLETTLRRAAEQFSAVVLTGPRQSGKTTLVRELFGETHAYCSLDDPLTREQAVSDPKFLLERYSPPVILDEIQYAPDLLHYVKLDIDEHRDHKGRYVVTGSQVFALMQGVSESLAGRAAVLSLLSMSLVESVDRPGGGEDPWHILFPVEGRAEFPPMRADERLNLVRRGGYPEVVTQSSLDVELWLTSYVQTYLERDVRTLLKVGDLNDFQRFLSALAARTASLINYSDLARDLGITGKTVKAWVSVLEASGLATVVKPFHVNLGKRLVKRPKVYFNDTGVLAYLLGVTSGEQLIRGIAAGPMFEAAVYNQLVRLFLHRGRNPRLYFWRTASGFEVDFVLERGLKLHPIEAKLTATPTPRDVASIVKFQKLFGERAGRGALVCLCDRPIPLADGVDAIPLGAF